MLVGFLEKSCNRHTRLWTQSVDAQECNRLCSHKVSVNSTVLLFDEERGEGGAWGQGRSIILGTRVMQGTAADLVASGP